MTTAQKISDVHIAYHRNGIGGEPFYAVTFTDADNGPMVAVVFPDDEGEFGPPPNFTNPRTAVFQRDLLGEGVIAFGANSWRGDNYDTALRSFIAEYERRG